MIYKSSALLHFASDAPHGVQSESSKDARDAHVDASVESASQNTCANLSFVKFLSINAF